MREASPWGEEPMGRWVEGREGLVLGSRCPERGCLETLNAAGSMGRQGLS